MRHHTNIKIIILALVLLNTGVPLVFPDSLPVIRNADFSYVYTLDGYDCTIKVDAEAETGTGIAEMRYSISLLNIGDMLSLAGKPRLPESSVALSNLAESMLSGNQVIFTLQRRFFQGLGKVRQTDLL